MDEIEHGESNSFWRRDINDPINMQNLFSLSKTY